MILPPTVGEAKGLLLAHLQEHYAFYGERTGLLTARKHIGWYVQDLVGGEDFRGRMNALLTLNAQYQAVADFFDELAMDYSHVPYVSEHVEV